jgi:hypothetical protein
MPLRSKIRIDQGKARTHHAFTAFAEALIQSSFPFMTALAKPPVFTGYAQGRAENQGEILRGMPFSFKCAEIHIYACLFLLIILSYRIIVRTANF